VKHRIMLAFLIEADARPQVELINIMGEHRCFESSASYMPKRFFYACFCGLLKLHDLPCSATLDKSPGIRVVSAPRKAHEIGGGQTTFEVSDCPQP
jgi:hypothetical protein